MRESTVAPVQASTLGRIGSLLTAHCTTHPYFSAASGSRGLQRQDSRLLTCSLNLDRLCIAPSEYFDWESGRGHLNDLQTPPNPENETCLGGGTHVFVPLRAGMVFAVKQTLRLKESGLLWGGVPCSLLIWISLGTSLRNIYYPMGDPESKQVQLSNLCLSRYALLVILAIARCCFWAAEQPQSSYLKDIPCYDWILHIPGLQSMMTRLPETEHLVIQISHGLASFKSVCSQCSVLPSYMGAFKHFALKPTYVIGSWRGITGCGILKSRPCRKPQAWHRLPVQALDLHTKAKD